MNSSISAFRAFRALFGAMACVIVIEAACAALLPADLDLLRSPLLHMSYYKPIRPERINTVAKIALAERLPGDIIQVGESTGLAGIQPNLINPMLPDGLKLLNLSTQLPTEFAGFATTEELGLRAHPDAKYAMVVISPLHLGMVTEGFGADVKRYYLQFPLWKRLPSLKGRAFVLNLLYYRTVAPYSLYTTNADKNGLSKRLQELLDFYEHSGGWTPVSLHREFKPEACRPAYDTDRALARLQEFYTVAAMHHARLILVLAPLRCTPDDTTARLESDVQEFLATHAGTIAPLPLIDVVPHDWLGDDVHLTPEASSKYSRILGEALAHSLSAASVSNR